MCTAGNATQLQVQQLMHALLGALEAAGARGLVRSGPTRASEPGELRSYSKAGAGADWGAASPTSAAAGAAALPLVQGLRPSSSASARALALPARGSVGLTSPQSSLPSPSQPAVPLALQPAKQRLPSLGAPGRG